MAIQVKIKNQAEDTTMITLDKDMPHIQLQTRNTKVQENIAIELEGADQSDATAVAGDILSGKTAYVSSGKVAGTIPSKGGATIVPGTSDQTIAQGQYLSGAQTIKGDANLTAENIAKDVTIFGVVGTHQGGTITTDATATAADILSPKTAYIADGSKATGTILTKTASDMTVLNNTVTVPTGYYASNTDKSIPVSVLDNTIISGEAFLESAGDYGWKTTVDVPAGYHNSQRLEKTFSSVFPAPTTPGTSADVRLGKQFYDKDGKVVTGTMTEKAAATYTPSSSAQTISADQYLAGAQTISAVPYTETENAQGGITVTIL